MSPRTTIIVPAGPLGLILDTDKSQKTTLVKGFCPLPNNQVGSLERHQLVQPGDVLVAIDDTDLHGTDFHHVLELLSDAGGRARQLTFCSGKEYYKAQRQELLGGGGRRQQHVRAGVVDSAVVRQDGVAKYATYHIVVECQYDRDDKLELLSNKKRWEVSRRYSEFAELDGKLRTTLGWQMTSIVFPPKKTFYNMTDEFIAQRLVLLGKYLEQVMEIKGITEFHRHFGNPELADFLEYEEHMANSHTGQSSSAQKQGDDPDLADQRSSKQEIGVAGRYFEASLEELASRSDVQQECDRVRRCRGRPQFRRHMRRRLPLGDSGSLHGENLNNDGESHNVRLDAGPPPSQEASNDIPGKEDVDPAYKRYIKLFQLGVPMEQIQLKMKVEDPELSRTRLEVLVGSSAGGSPVPDLGSTKQPPATTQLPGGEEGRSSLLESIRNGKRLKQTTDR